MKKRNHIMYSKNHILSTMTMAMVPVSCDPAFRYERLRKEDTALSFGGFQRGAVQYLHTDTQVDNDTMHLYGPDIPELPEGASHHLGIEILVQGPHLKAEFEELMERQIGRYLCDIRGVTHSGERDFFTLEISRESFAQGLSFSHLATVIHRGLLEDYGSLLKSVEIRLSCSEEYCRNLLLRAKKAYTERDSRTSKAADEDVDNFYRCTMCQSYIPYHLCIISPDRDGLCGRFTWRDAELNHALNRLGPFAPVRKGRCIDLQRGEWEGVNRALAELTHERVSRFSAYSLTEFPETSCRCAECIVAIVPEARGVMAVHRNYRGTTPTGMDFETLIDIVGRGRQVPGFLGISLSHLASRKFLNHHGGIRRLVWMPSDLKSIVRGVFTARCKEEDMPDLLNLIGDEQITPSMPELLSHLRRAGHPALTLDPLI